MHDIEDRVRRRVAESTRWASRPPLSACPVCWSLPFATLRASRIDTGDGVGLFAAAGAVPAAALLLAVAGRGRALGAQRALRVVRRQLADWRQQRRSSAWWRSPRSRRATCSRRRAPTRGSRSAVARGRRWLRRTWWSWRGRREAAAIRPLSLAVQTLVPAGIAVLLLTGSLVDLGIVREYGNWSDRFWAEVGNHLVYTGAAVGVALVLGSAIGIAAFSLGEARAAAARGREPSADDPGTRDDRHTRGPALGRSPARSRSCKDLGVGGLGWAPVVIALTLYALLVVVHDVVVGLRGVSRRTRSTPLAGMGMTGAQLMRRVRLPLAAPVVYTGARTAALQTVGNATLGAFVAAGTLGLFITQGLAEGSADLVLLGAHHARRARARAGRGAAARRAVRRTRACAGSSSGEAASSVIRFDSVTKCYAEAARPAVDGLLAGGPRRRGRACSSGRRVAASRPRCGWSTA